MFGSVCFYNNQIYAADINGNLIAYEFLKFKKKDEQQSFKENLRLKIPLPELFHIKSIVLDAVDNYLSSLKCLTIVAISLYGDISVHLFCPNIKNTLINISTSDWLPLLNVKPNCNFFISHGPTLLFSSPQEIFLCLLPYKMTSRFNSHISDHYNSNKIIQFTSIGRLNTKEPVSVLLLIQSYETSSGSKMLHASSIEMKIKQKDSPVVYHEIPIHHFFPTNFQNSVEMIYVWNILIDELQASYEDIKWKCNYSFLCTKTDSLLFCNGRLKYILEKPGLNILYIITEFYEMHFNSLKLIVVSTTKDVYFVTSKASSHSLQLNKTWKNIETVVFGDILMNGSKQLLLLKNTLYNSWQDDCILSDISDFVPVDYVTQNKEAECSMSRAMPGIQAKILAGKSAITNTKSNIEKKMEATLDSLYKLNMSTVVKARIDHHISSFRESLVDIILSKDEVNESRKDGENKIKLSIHKHWKQLCNNHWMLYWTFSNNDDRKNPMKVKI
ncbi:unnamed protein product [Larinioides sclopetarius]|uniref:Uncharacterized protein n=1 Tax=Larinioides sclopetarius TaxID=280406 RepID=A0AAV2BLV9_9ARAC